MKIYDLLAPYLYILFTGMVTYCFFLKQYTKEKQADRDNQISQYRDSLHKEIFDQIQLKVSEIYESLGWVRSFSRFLDDSKLDYKIFEIRKERFFVHNDLLVDRLFLLSLLIETYDFIIDDDHCLGQECLKLHIEFEEISINIRSIAPESDLKTRKEVAQTLFEMTGATNTHMKKISDESKAILKNILDSLDKKIKI